MDNKKVLIFLLVAAAIMAIIVSFMGKSSPIPEPQSYAQDFSWVKGRLERNPLEGGFWQVKFGDESVPYNGKFVLGNDSKLEEFESGDLVKITGRISPQQVSIYMSGTIYSITSIEKIGE